MDKLPVEVAGITGFAPYQGYVVILKESQSRRWLPIFIGGVEAHNISLLLQGVKYIRPLTYDLFANLLEAAEARVEEVVVTDLRDSTFFAEVSLRLADGERRLIDARPSDAIALAIKTQAPIFVRSHVMDEAGMHGEIAAQAVNVDEKLQELYKQLQEAVQQEAYEEAASIRDQIRALEERLHSG